MARTFLINSVDRTAFVLNAESGHPVKFNFPMGSPWSCEFTTRDTVYGVGAFHPEPFDTVEIKEGSTTIFLGRIKKIDHGSIDSKTGAKTIVTCDSIAEVTDEIIGEDDIWTTNPNVKTVLTWLVTTYLNPVHGITLDAAQANGANLGNLNYNGYTIREMLNDMSVRTGWPWRITPGGVLRMFAVGDIVSSYALSATTTIGLFRWSQTVGKYANKVELTYGPTAVLPKDWSVVGDGATDEWELEYTAKTSDGSHIMAIAVFDSDAGGPLPIGADPGDVIANGYNFKVATNRMQRALGDLPNTETATMSYQVQFPQVVTDQDNVEISARGGRVVTFRARNEKIIDKESALAYAAGLLRQMKSFPKVSNPIGTFETALNLPGNEIEVDFPDVDFDETCFITNVTGQEAIDGRILWMITVTTGTEFPGSFTDQMRSALGSGSGSHSSTGALGSIIPVSDGRFTGEVAAFLNSTDEISLTNGMSVSFPTAEGAGIRYGRDVSGKALDTIYTPSSILTPRSMLSWVWRSDKTVFGAAMRLVRQDAAQAVLLPGVHTGSGASTDQGSFLGDPHGLTGLSLGLSSANRRWAGAMIAYLATNLGLYEQGRSTAAWKWVDVAHAGGDYTASGSMTWTVQSGDQNTKKYTLAGNTMLLVWDLVGTTVGGTVSTALRIKIPGGYTARGPMYVGAHAYLDNSSTASVIGICYCPNGATYVELYKIPYNSPWTASTNLTGSGGFALIEVNPL